MRLRRNRNGLAVTRLSRVGSFLRRTSLIDRYGSNPRPFADTVSPYDSLHKLAEEKARRHADRKELSIDEGGPPRVATQKWRETADRILAGVSTVLDD